MNSKLLKVIVGLASAALLTTSMIACGGSSSSSEGDIAFSGQVNAAAAPASLRMDDMHVPLSGITVDALGGMGTTDANGNYNFRAGSGFSGGPVLLTITDEQGNSTNFTIENIPANARSFAANFIRNDDGSFQLDGDPEIGTGPDTMTGDPMMDDMTSMTCGDGTIDEGEECDDGNTDDGDGCSSTCTNEVESVCGDGIVDAGEECDDGNAVDGDGCSAVCTSEISAVCGDGTIDAGEECDDGNTVDGDGCSATCTLEATAVCGDGAVEGTEQCDDANNIDGDGCSADCMTEAIPICGDGVIDAGEDCDDANNENGDGCSADCQIEVPEVLSCFCNDGFGPLPIDAICADTGMPPSSCSAP